MKIRVGHRSLWIAAIVACCGGTTWAAADRVPAVDATVKTVDVNELAYVPPPAPVVRIAPILTMAPTPDADARFPGAAPPASASTVPLNSTFYIEIWATNSNPPLDGLACVYIDLNYTRTDLIDVVPAEQNSPLFPVNPIATIPAFDDAAGLIDDLGGCQESPAISELGVAEWVLVERFEMNSLNVLGGPVAVTLGPSGNIFAFTTIIGDPFEVPPSEIEFLGLNFTVVCPSDECQIGGICIPGGGVNPDNECEECNPAVDPHDWSPVTDGTPCDDDLYCTVDDECTGGTCDGDPRDCSDGLVCTEDTCDEANDECDHDLIDGNCLIGGICYTDGDPDPGNECLMCDPLADPDGWTPVMDGTPCDDDLYCTVDDECTGGVCDGDPRDCSDGLVCTEDTCDEANDECDHELIDGNCLIGGICYTDGDPDPGNECLMCDPLADPDGWTPVMDGTPCDDDLYCTVDDECTGGVCDGDPRDCSDGLVCTEDTCDEANDECDHELIPGNCLIGGVCYSAFDLNPDNECLVCNPVANPHGWTPVTDGTPCDDDLYCTVDDECTGGTCEGDPRDCSDGLVCTEDTCDEANDECDHDLIDGNCLIGGICYTDGDPDPGNECLMCDPLTDPDGWTPVMDGTPCDDDLYCTVDDECTGGVCDGDPRDCSDGLVCTEDTCDEANDECDHELIDGNCLIGGICYTDGDPDPGNECLMCDPLADPDGWTPVLDGTPCDDDLYCTVDDECTGGTCDGDPRDCSDGLVCTEDTCDEANDECDHDLIPGNCLIGGVCYSAFDLNPDNECLVCNPAANPHGWTPVTDGTPCDDDLFCTVDDECTGGTCDGDPRDCSDGLVCTEDTCDEANDECDHDLIDGNCLIGGICYTDGDPDPGNECLMCDPLADPDGWTPVMDGTPCDDDLYCTIDDECTGGVCDGAPRDCDDGLTCTTDTCDDVDDECDNDLNPGTCLIGGICYNAGDLNPASDCELCDPVADAYDWSLAPNGFACNDGLLCTEGDICTDGECGGTPVECGPLQTCDPTDGLCKCGDCPFDMNENGGVDSGDYAAFLGCFGTFVDPDDLCYCSDVNENGGIDTGDYAAFLACFGEFCPCPTTPKASSSGGRGAQLTVQPVVSLSPFAPDYVNTLPESIDAVTAGSTFYVNVWASTGDRPVSDLACVFVDCAIDLGHNERRMEPLAVAAADGFSNLTEGLSKDASGIVRNVGGCIQPDQKELVIPERWALVATIEMQAGQSVGPASVTLQATGDLFRGVSSVSDAGNLRRSQLEFGTVSFEIVSDQELTVEPERSRKISYRRGSGPFNVIWHWTGLSVQSMGQALGNVCREGNPT